MTDETLELQFERAELDQPRTPSAAPPSATVVPRIACVQCGNHVRSYWSINGRSLCRACHDAAVADHRALLAPLLKASALGLVAAVAGALLYYGVARLTGYEIGFVAIAVGLMVGAAVRRGSGGRGGWRYQLLAVALCYLSIAGSYTASVFTEIARRQAAATAQARAAGVAHSVDAASAAAPSGATAPDEDDDRPGAAGMVGQLLLLVVKLPVLIGLESPMAFVLIAIALWEAWTLNAGRPFEASGPFAVATGLPAAP